MEPHPEPQTTKSNAWLIRMTGALAGTRHLVRGSVVRLGRDPANDVVLDSKESEIVSARHLEIRRKGDTYRLYDLNSTNGTYLNGKRVSEVTLDPSSVIMLGPNGPEFRFELDTLHLSDLKQTIAASETTAKSQELSVGNVSIVMDSSGAPMGSEHEALLHEAVKRARQARRMGIGGQTATIMREALHKAIHRSSRKFKVAIVALAVLLISVTTYAAWTVRHLKRQKLSIDDQIRQIESELRANADDPKRVDKLIEEVNNYQAQAHQVQKNLLYRLGVRSPEQDFIESEIKTLMAEFGAEEYSIPPEFVEQVRRFIRQYQGRDRAHIERALGLARKELQAVRKQLESDNLPQDLAYMVLVESALIAGDSSPAGTAGLWQFTPGTARAYGLRVADGVDERLNSRKATQAAGRYIRELILDFGSGSSVMLALAAYNLGPGKLKRAIRTVEDPIKQRNFWYLYRVRALPTETREYIPKIIAAIIVGRNPDRFGF